MSGSSARSICRNVVNDPENNLIDPDLEPYRLQEATVGIEHALTPTLSVAARYVHKQLDRAVEDIGALDAELNAIYSIGNPGFGRASIAHVFADGTTVPYPRAVRDYDAVELSLNKRLSDGWALRASYLWSRLWGNYTGLANGDSNGAPLAQLDSHLRQPDHDVRRAAASRSTVRSPRIGPTSSRPSSSTTSRSARAWVSTRYRGERHARHPRWCGSSPLTTSRSSTSAAGATAGPRLAPRSTCSSSTRSASAGRSGCSSS